MTLTKPQITPDEIMDLTCHASERETLLDFVRTYQATNTKSVSPAAAIALYLIEDLFSASSSDEANINRITTNLEAVADDLLTLSKMVRGLL